MNSSRKRHIDSLPFTTQKQQLSTPGMSSTASITKFPQVSLRITDSNQHSGCQMDRNTTWPVQCCYDPVSKTGNFSIVINYCITSDVTTQLVSIHTWIQQKLQNFKKCEVFSQSKVRQVKLNKVALEIMRIITNQQVLYFTQPCDLSSTAGFDQDLCTTNLLDMTSLADKNIQITKEDFCSNSQQQWHSSVRLQRSLMHIHISSLNSQKCLYALFGHFDIFTYLER